MGRYKYYCFFIFLICTALLFVTGYFANCIFKFEGIGPYVLWFLVFVLYFIFAYIMIMKGRAWFPYAVITRINDEDDFIIFCQEAIGKNERTFNKDKNKHQLKIEFPRRTKYTMYYSVKSVSLVTLPAKSNPGCDPKLEKIDVDFFSDDIPHIELPVLKEDEKKTT